MRVSNWRTLPMVNEVMVSQGKRHTVTTTFFCGTNSMERGCVSYCVMEESSTSRASSIAG